MTILIEREQADFKLFLSLWNRVQGQATPGLHFCLADWLETRWEAGNTRLLLQAFRSSGKSTITGLFAAWLLYRRPDLRILVLAADQPLAQKMVRNVRRIIERHPLTQSLRPGQADQWAADRFTINRTLELRDPSMLARGIGANLTGSRADIVICDDVEVPNTCDSAEKTGRFAGAPGGGGIRAGAGRHAFVSRHAAQLVHHLRGKSARGNWGGAGFPGRVRTVCGSRS